MMYKKCIVEYDKLKTKIKTLINRELCYKKPNFYIIITAKEMFDNRLTDFEKLLIGQIRTLTKKNGYAYAKNKYLSQINGKSERTIKRAIGKLKKLEYIKVWYISKNKEIIARIIKVLDISNNGSVKNVTDSNNKNVTTSSVKNGTYNNINKIIQDNTNLNKNYVNVNKHVDKYKL